MPGSGVPLSAQQESFLQWMQAGPQLRHPIPVCVALRIRDAFDASLLADALRPLTRRHEALRMMFPARDGRREPLIVPQCPPEVRTHVAGGTTLAEKLASAQELACRERNREFDLERGPLVRAVVIELAPDDQVLVLVVHHLVFDAWSMDVLLRELGMIYSLLAAGYAYGDSLPEPMQCSEVVYQSRHFRAGDPDAWSQALAGAPGGLENFAGRTPTEEFAPRLLSFVLPAELAGQLRTVARDNRVTTFMVVLAAWSATLSSWSGVSDIVLTSPVAGRAFPGAETAIGCLFGNTLIRVDTSGQPEFGELLRRVRSATLAAWRRPAHQFAEFRDDFARSPYVSYDGSRVPLHFPGRQSESFPLPPQLEQLRDDLDVPQLRLRDDQIGAIAAELVYNAEAISEATIAKLGGDFIGRLPRG